MAEPSRPRDLDQEVEVLPAIRHDDAEWKVIQQNTFTRWVNNHLKKSGTAIGNLETDFADGLKLICLAEALSHKRLGRYNKKVNFRSQKLENVSLALSFFQDVEHIKIVNIDSTHIVDQNKKLILGLIWTLILHYSISMGWIAEPSQQGQQDDTPKQKLLNWVRGRLPAGLPLTNFTSDWNDGIALGALVDSMAPGAVPNWESMHPNNALANTERAMNAAKDHLGVEPLIAPEELIHPEIDEMSVMTYLSQFPTSVPKPVPVLESSAEIVIPAAVPIFARIENLEECPVVNHTCDFEIVCSEGHIPNISIVYKTDQVLPVKIVQNGSGKFTIEFTPVHTGPHFIHLAVQHENTGEILPVQDKPTHFMVVPAARLGPYNENVRIGEPVEFRVEDAIHGVVEIVVVDAGDAETTVPLRETLPGVFTGTFVPKTKGLHSVNVFYRKAHLSGSPFPLRVSSAIPSYTAWGRGLEADGVRVGDTVPINISFPEKVTPAVSQKFEITVTNKTTGRQVPVHHVPSSSAHDIVFSYTPVEKGEYEICVFFDSEPLEHPKTVSVGPRSNSPVKAFGPGLEGGIVNQEGIFQVDSRGDPGRLSFFIEGPSESQITAQDKGDGICLVSYTPKLPGVYKVQVLSDGEHITDSPFVVKVQPADPKFHPAAARITGLDKPCVAQDKFSFGVDTKRTNVDTAPEVIILDKDLNKVSHSIHEVNPCLHAVEFVPSHPGTYHIDCRLRGVALPGCPYTLEAKEPIDVSKLRMYGPGIDGPVVAKEPTHFTIDAKQAGPGAVEVALSDRQGQAVDIDVLDHQDGSFTVKYTAPRPGAYQLNVVFAGEEISPIEINVQPRVDTSGIVVSGLENKFFPGQRVRISVDLGNQSVPDGPGLVVTVNDGSGEIPLPVREKSSGVYEVVYMPPGIGTYAIKITFDDEPFHQTSVTVVPGCDPSKCVVDMEKMRNAAVGDKAKFAMDTRETGDGSLSVSIDGPAESPCSIAKNDSTYVAEFTPTAPGIYTIGIRLDDVHVPGSPFVFDVDYVSDPSKVTVSGIPKEVSLGSPVEFEVNAELTKAAPVSCVLPNGQPVPTSSTHGRRHTFHFVPVGQPGDKLPIEVLYDNIPIHKSYVKLVRSVFPENLKFLSDGQIDTFTVQPAGQDAIVGIDVTDCGKFKVVRAEVIGPDGKSRPNDLRPRSSDGLFDLVFPTALPGAYVVRIKVDGETVVEEFTVEAVKTGKPEDSTVPVGSSHHMDFSRSSDFLKLTAESSNPGAADIVIKTRKTPSGFVDEVTITPKSSGENIVKFAYNGKPFYEIRFQGVEQPASTPRSEVDSYEHNYDNNNKPKGPVDYAPREFKFETGTTLRFEKLTAVVTMPSNKQTDQAQIVDNHDGSILVKYTPKTFGHHELSIYHDGTQVQGTPVKFFVDSYGDGYATVYGPGLQSAVVGEPAAFTVVAKGSHAKELSVSIEGPAQSTIKIHDNKDGTCSVTWVPPVPGEYRVHVKLGNKEVRNSPFSVLVAGEGQKRSHLSVGSTSEVALNITQTELKGISASIKSPSGIEEPCFVRLIDGGRLGVSFTPRESGEHLITVKRDGKLLPKAPFKIKVDKSQVGDASKVEVSGTGRSRAVCQQENEILVDTSKAGFGGLSVSVQGPSKAELKCKEVKAGLIKVIYRPTEPGVYVIAIKFADHHVKDSPITVNCTGKGAGRVAQEIKRHAEQATVCLPDHEGNVYFKLPNTSPMDINARIMDPKGKTEDVEMRDIGDQFYQIRFRPQIEGVHNLSVMHKDAHVNGSPFPFTVGPFGEGGAHKVRASGMGVVRGETNTVNSFNIYTREAGSGNLSVAVEGPAKAAVEFKDHKDGNCHVDYKVAVAGEYTVAVKFNDQHIPDSPFKVFIAAATGEARKLELAQFHDNVPTGKAYTFTVLTHRAKGHLEAKVMTPSNDTETIDIVPIEEGESYALRFIPRETGNHYIHVTLDGAPMRDSPFRLRVGAKDLSDPTAISASGEGLVKGVTGQKTEFIIRTVNAGAGILTVQVDGPSKVTLDAYELDHGYKVRFTPLAPGDYFAAVKYNGIHIPGSPFKVPVTGKELGGNGYNETSFVKIDASAKTSKGTVATVPEYKGDASKVVVKGAGLNKFFPGRPAVFTIDTGLAGPNILMVGVVTTRGPCEEVIVKHQGNGHYIVNYKVHDRVKGFIFIKYGDQEVPGSPFAIEP